ncbi:MAG: C69 family dipeptidase [Acidobacteria bacterium]|nr:C69 family dipeptidase [Acidobacteriota bacterium]
MRRPAQLIVSTILFALVLGSPAGACTNYLVTRGATIDGSTLISYSADSHELYGELYQTFAGTFPEGATVQVVEWDTSKPLARIRQARVLYATIGNINEHQVAVGETTFGGREELVDPEGGVDYGSLMYLALQRAKTAREAIKVMTDLVAEYGYASSGETFSISDENEAWIMEMVGKGKGNKGAVWVARRIPDGYVSAHANASRIRTFPLNDPQNTLYAKDVISFAREKGWFNGKDEEFSFADTYAPLDFGALRFCEARVWSFFRRVAPSLDLPFDRIKGDAVREPLPLWIKPDRKLAVQDVMHLMRDHFEGTELDLSKGLGAGPFALPYRWRPMTWKVGDEGFVHERSVSTQQTGFSFIAQSRNNLPDPIGGVLWFGVDDTFCTVYTPMYCGIRRVPKAFAVGTADFETFSWDSGFWVFNWVSNFAYSRWRDMILDIQALQGEMEGSFLSRQAEIEQAALVLYQQSPELARNYLTEYSVAAGDDVVRRWRTLGEKLLVKYMDGNVRDSAGNVTHPEYPEDWYRRIVADEGESRKAFKLPGEKSE